MKRSWENLLCKSYGYRSFYLLILNRIDRYTRAAQSSAHDLTSYNLHPAGIVPQTPRSYVGNSAAFPGSPIQSMQTQPSASNLAEQGSVFSALPPGALSGPLYPVQQARLNQSSSTTNIANLPAQPTSPTSTKDSENFDRPRNSSSITINPNVLTSPQPLGAGNIGPWSPEEQSLNLSRTTSSVALGGEPRIFPGVVSRSARRSSLRSGQLDDLGEGSAYSGFRRADTGSVTEEPTGLNEEK